MLAPDLLGESLALQLTTANPSWEVLLKPDALPGHPALVVWSIDAVISLGAIQQEAMRLGERWQPALPQSHRFLLNRTKGGHSVDRPDHQGGVTGQLVRL